MQTILNHFSRVVRDIVKIRFVALRTRAKGSPRRLMDPLVHGHYPASMCNDLSDKLPTFSEEEAEALKGSFDFIGLNHYTTHYAKNDPYGPEFSHYGVEFHDARIASIS